MPKTMFRKAMSRDTSSAGLTLTDLSAVRECESTGFTLIELLVVISIISLLVSILLPSLNRAKDQAKLVVCLSNQRNVYLGAVLYAEEHGTWLPPVYRGAATYSQPLKFLLSVADVATGRPAGSSTGAGMLVELDYTGEKLFDCPDTKYVDFDPGSVHHDANGKMRIGEYVWYVSTLYHGLGDVRYNAPKLADEYAGDPLAADYCFRLDHPVHSGYKPHGLRMNIVFVDGQVITVIDSQEELYNLGAGSPNYGQNYLFQWLRDWHPG